MTFQVLGSSQRGWHARSILIVPFLLALQHHEEGDAPCHDRYHGRDGDDQQDDHLLNAQIEQCEHESSFGCANAKVQVETLARVIR